MESTIFEKTSNTVQELTLSVQKKSYWEVDTKSGLLKKVILGAIVSELIILRQFQRSPSGSQLIEIKDVLITENPDKLLSKASEVVRSLKTEKIDLKKLMSSLAKHKSFKFKRIKRSILKRLKKFKLIEYKYQSKPGLKKLMLTDSGEFTKQYLMDQISIIKKQYTPSEIRLYGGSKKIHKEKPTPELCLTNLFNLLDPHGAQLRLNTSCPNLKLPKMISSLDKKKKTASEHSFDFMGAKRIDTEDFSVSWSSGSEKYTFTSESGTYSFTTNTSESQSDKLVESI